MRILVLSLLRLGDLLMQKPLLDGLRRRYPGARLEIVVNPGASVAREAIDGVDEWIVFDRDRLQSAVGAAEIPLFAPVREVRRFMDDLSARNYDFIFNFTHNRLSAHLSAGIVAREKFGLLAEGRGFRRLEGRWARHFNERFGWRGATPFHYTELLAGVFGFDVAPASAVPRGSRILLQPLTSDAKKNWSLENWKKVLHALRLEGRDVKILGAPFESEILAKHFECEDLLLAGLGEVRRALADTALVITGDTSIKHLAVLEGVPTLEIALGSAEPHLTGAYQRGAVMMRSSVGCAPCPPSSMCRKLSHECGESFSVEKVLAAATQMKATAKDVAGEWIVEDSDSLGVFVEGFEKHLWRVFLNQKTNEATSIGSSFIARALQQGFDPAAALEALDREQTVLSRHLESTVSTLKNSAGLCLAGRADPAAIQILRRHLSTLSPANRRLRAHTIELSEAGHLPFAHPLAFFGHVRRAAEDFGERLEIRQRWLTLIREMGGYHERIARDLPERGLETP